MRGAAKHTPFLALRCLSFQTSGSCSAAALVIETPYEARLPEMLLNANTFVFVKFLLETGCISNGGFL